MEPGIYRQSAHCPSHLFVPNAAYIVTGATYRKELLFDSAAKRTFLLHSLFEEAQHWQWSLQAWAIMSNHYHFVAHAPSSGETLKRMITSLHSKTAIWLNENDATPGRKVWFQYWDTCLTFQQSYLARLNYVHNNPVKHRLAANAALYPWCSMTWFMQGADSTGATILAISFGVDDDARALAKQIGASKLLDKMSLYTELIPTILGLKK